MIHGNISLHRDYGDGCFGKENERKTEAEVDGQHQERLDRKENIIARIRRRKRLVKDIGLA